MLRQQRYHRSEERRLATRQKIGPRTVGHEPVGVDQPGEVVDHVAHQVEAVAARQAQHGEVAVPIEHLIEAPARYHVGLGQRDQTAPGAFVGIRWVPGQVRPQVDDVGLDRGIGRLAKARFVLRTRIEVGIDEGLQPGLVDFPFLLLQPFEVGHDSRGVALGNQIDHRLPIRIELRHGDGLHYRPPGTIRGLPGGLGRRLLHRFPLDALRAAAAQQQRCQQ